MSMVVSLALATIAFVGTHFLMSHPLRAGMVARLGNGGFQGVYALVSFLTLGWMVYAWRAAPSDPLYIAPLWWWHAATWIILFPTILFAGSLIGNPAAPGPRASELAMKPALGALAITRHPMMWAFMLWAVIHISLYGSARNLIVAAGVFILALFGSLGQDRKKRGVMGDSWRGWEARTSYVPFGALVSGKIPWRAVLPIWPAALAGIALWAIVTWWHAPLFVPWGRIIGPEVM